MALEGFDLLIIVAALAIIFLWGPNKLPEMARAIGQAKREFDKASKDITSLANPASLANPQTRTATTTQAPQDPIIIAAKSLGIGTEGKTKEEIAREIVTRTTKNSVQQNGKETPVAAA